MHLFSSFSLREPINKTVFLAFLSTYLSILEFYLSGSVKFTFWLGFLLRLLWALFTKYNSISPEAVTLLQILLAGYSIMFTLYYSIFCLPLSLVSCIVTNLVALCQPQTLRRIVVLVIALSYINGGINLPELTENTDLPKYFFSLPELNHKLYELLYPLSIWITL